VGDEKRGVMVPVKESTLSYTVTSVVDLALDAMRDRSTMISTHDVTDLLLDLRSSLRQTVLLEEAAAASERDRRPRGPWSVERAKAAERLLRRPFASRATS
jgi:hypothetical protein